MKTSSYFASVFFSFVALSEMVHGQSPLGTGFTYQGQLKDGGVTFNGNASMIFRLYDVATDGNPLGTQTVNNVSIANGLFAVILNAGGQLESMPFTGQSRWLEITVNGTLLSPRQQLTAAPYALGLRLPVSETVSTTSNAVEIINTGTGRAGRFEVNNSAGSVAAIFGVNNGSGAAVAGTQTGTGRAGFFSIDNPSSNSSALVGLTNGTGNGVTGQSDSSTGIGGLFINTTGSVALHATGDAEITGFLGVGNTSPQAPLHVTGGTDATPNSGGFAIFGGVLDNNIVIDNNEIMARNGAQSATLQLNKNGGDVSVGGSLIAGYEQIRVTTQGAQFTLNPSCSAGKTLLSGICDTNDPGVNPVLRSFPVGNDGWHCEFYTDGYTMPGHCYIVCASLK